MVFRKLRKSTKKLKLSLLGVALTIKRVTHPLGDVMSESNMDEEAEKAMNQELGNDTYNYSIILAQHA